MQVGLYDGCKTVVEVTLTCKLVSLTHPNPTLSHPLTFCLQGECMPRTLPRTTSQSTLMLISC